MSEDEPGGEDATACARCWQPTFAPMSCDVCGAEDLCADCASIHCETPEL